MSHTIKLSFLYPIFEPLGHLRFSTYFSQHHHRLGQRVQTIARAAFLTLTTLFCLSFAFAFIPIKPIYLSPPLVVVGSAWIMTHLLTPPKKDFTSSDDPSLGLTTNSLTPFKEAGYLCMSPISSNDPVICRLDSKFKLINK